MPVPRPLAQDSNHYGWNPDGIAITDCAGIHRPGATATRWPWPRSRPRGNSNAKASSRSCCDALGWARKSLSPTSRDHLGRSCPRCSWASDSRVLRFSGGSKTEQATRKPVESSDNMGAFCRSRNAEQTP